MALIYVDQGGGLTGTADVAAGACRDSAGTPGGSAEAGASLDDPSAADGATPDAYAVVDGDNDNADPLDQSDGYFGVSNYETGAERTTDAECAASGPDNGSANSSNSGGCLATDAVGGGVFVPGDAPTPMCGNTSGNSFSGTGNTEGSGNRDGCSIP